VKVQDLPTPALVIDGATLEHNIDVMAAARPGSSLRPHVKAFKSTDLARHVAERGGHRSFCCATLREMEGMAAAGLGDDLLLANETLDSDRLGRLVDAGTARVTVAVDSPETLEVAARAGAEVLIDVDVGLPRCGCLPTEAGPLAAAARATGVAVRGVMGYEGHVVGNPDRAARTVEVERSMALLRSAHEDVGGITSAGGTGTYDLHHWADEVQAGSYLLMDSHYEQLGLPFRQALFVVATVISTSPTKGWGVVDAGLKAFGMDHGDPSTEGHDVFFCSDEHTTFLTGPDARLPAVGDRLRMVPAHVDPTVALHERMYVLDGDDVVDEWAVDLRNW
jgi:D-serine deaminase-like pyridoxal phosphate-dependent protein